MARSADRDPLKKWRVQPGRPTGKETPILSMDEIRALTAAKKAAREAAAAKKG